MDISQLPPVEVEQRVRILKKKSLANLQDNSCTIHSKVIYHNKQSL